MPAETDTFLDDLDLELGAIPGTQVKDDVKPDDVKPDDTKPPIKPDDTKPEEPPQFKREQKKPVPKEESIAALRKQRDEAIQASKLYTETFGEHKPEVIKPLLDLVIEEADGPITAEYVTNKISEFKTLKEKITELETELQDKEKKVTELDIRFSDEFNKGYKEPYEQAFNTLFLEFASVTEDKQIIAPKATQEFRDFLVANPDIDGIEVKVQMQKFAKAYKAESGEDATLPSVNSLMQSLRQFKTARERMQVAYTDWKKTKQQQQQQQIAEQQLQTEAQKRANKKARIELASKAFRNFDLDAIPFVTEKKRKNCLKKSISLVKRFTKEKKFQNGISLFSVALKPGCGISMHLSCMNLLNLKKRLTRMSAVD